MEFGSALNAIHHQSTRMSKVPVKDKVAYVRAAPNPGLHYCHWPGCFKEVKPAFWGCLPHWYRLPEYFRKKIWQTYMPGQEITKTPSKEYLAVANEIQVWIRKNI